MPDSIAAAAASSAHPPHASAEAGAEPGLAELAGIIGAPAAPAAKAKAPNKPAPAKKPAAKVATEDHDPEFDDSDDSDDEQPGDPTADADPDNEDLDAPEGADEAAGSEADDEAAGEEASGREQNTEEDSDENADEESDEDDEGEAPEGLDADDVKTRKALPPAAQKAFDKAIGKKVRQIRERDEQIKTLQSELTEAKANPPAPIEATPESPLAGVTDTAALDKRLAEFRNLRKWALTHPEGGTVKVGDKDVEISRERVAEILVETEEMLQEHGPKRRQWIEQDRQLTQQATQSYPWLAQKNTPGYLAVENMLRQYGHVPLREIPGIRGDLADLFIGQMIRHQQKQQAAGKSGGATVAGGKKAAVVPKAPATPAGGARPPKVAGAVKQAGHASKMLEETGDDPDNAALGNLIGTRPTRRN